MKTRQTHTDKKKKFKIPKIKNKNNFNNGAPVYYSQSWDADPCPEEINQTETVVINLGI